MRGRLRRPEKTPETLLLDMEAAGLIETADVLRPHSQSLEPLSGSVIPWLLGAAQLVERLHAVRARSALLQGACIRRISAQGASARTRVPLTFPDRERLSGFSRVC